MEKKVIGSRERKRKIIITFFRTKEKYPMYTRKAHTDAEWRGKKNNIIMGRGDCFSEASCTGSRTLENSVDELATAAAWETEREREERKINKKWSSSGDFTCDRNRKMKNEKIEKKKILELKVVAGRKETAAGMAATISLFTFSVHCKCLYLGFNIHTHTHTRQPTK